MEKFAAMDVKCINSRTPAARPRPFLLRRFLLCRFLPRALPLPRASLTARILPRALPPPATPRLLFVDTCPAFICSADQASSCHFDQHSNVMLVLYGKKVVYLSPPDMLVSSGGRKHYNTDATPRNTQFAMKFEIRAGDMLLIPSGWWHYVETKGMTGMLNFFFN